MRAHCTQHANQCKGLSASAHEKSRDPATPSSLPPAVTPPGEFAARQDALASITPAFRARCIEIRRGGRS